MPLDNIESTDAIQEISYDVFKTDLIQEFIRKQDGSIWDKYGDGMSDIYIERVATEIIETNLLNT